MSKKFKAEIRFIKDVSMFLGLLTEKLGVPFEHYLEPEENLTELLSDLIQKIEYLKDEYERLKAGEFTKEEIHNFCHNIEKTVPLEEFAERCRLEMQKLYGKCPIMFFPPEVKFQDEVKNE